MRAKLSSRAAWRRTREKGRRTRNDLTFNNLGVGDARHARRDAEHGVGMPLRDEQGMIAVAS